MFLLIYLNSTWREQKQLVSCLNNRREDSVVGLSFSLEIFDCSQLNTNSICLRTVKKDKALWQIKLP